MKLEELMLVGAVRYALGIRSNIVEKTCDFVASVKGELSQECIDIIIGDIEVELLLRRRISTHRSHPRDERNWLKLLEVLKEEMT